MLSLLFHWYKRRFSDPQAIGLLAILLAAFCILFFFSGLLAPLLVALVLAYLLEWPVVRLQPQLGNQHRVNTLRRHSAGYGTDSGAGCLAAGH